MDEPKRLSALRELKILDTPPEEDFDDLVLLAAQICKVPISLVSVVEEHRQWFKASIGLAVRETPREVSFCAHAIQQECLFEVEDATRDQRFLANALVTGQPGIRFYAGMPLVLADGSPLGTLCVIDTVPRTLTDGQRSALAILAKQVMARIEMREQRRSLEAALEERSNLTAQLEEANRRLRELAATDPLTGLFNRRVLKERLQAEFAAAERYCRELSLLMVDVDRFKDRNDRWGHTAGDDVLRKLSCIFTAVLRAQDTAARYGGEEFALLLPETGEHGAREVAERLQAAIAATPWQHEPVTVSIGIASRGSALTGDELVQLADEALYAAKRTGRNRIVVQRSPLPAQNPLDARIAADA